MSLPNDHRAEERAVSGRAEARKVLELAKDDRLHALYVLALYLRMRRAARCVRPSAQDPPR